MKSFRKLLGSVVGLILASLLTSTLAFAQHGAKGDNGANGQQVAVDKQTGKLRQPSAEEVQELLNGVAAMLNQSTEGLTVVKHDNGSQSVDLQDRFMSVSMAKIGPDGKVQQKCVTTVEEAKQFLSSDANKNKVNPKPASALEEK